jgi:hypothetical protein
VSIVAMVVAIPRVAVAGKRHRLLGPDIRAAMDAVVEVDLSQDGSPFSRLQRIFLCRTPQRPME